MKPAQTEPTDADATNMDLAARKVYALMKAEFPDGEGNVESKVLTCLGWFLGNFIRDSANPQSSWRALLAIIDHARSVPKRTIQ